MKLQVSKKIQKLSNCYHFRLMSLEETDPIRSVGLIRVLRTTPSKTYQHTYLVKGIQLITWHSVTVTSVMTKRRIFRITRLVRK